MGSCRSLSCGGSRDLPSDPEKLPPPTPITNENQAVCCASHEKQPPSSILPAYYLPICLFSLLHVTWNELACHGSISRFRARCSKRGPPTRESCNENKRRKRRRKSRPCDVKAGAEQVICGSVDLSLGAEKNCMVGGGGGFRIGTDSLLRPLCRARSHDRQNE
jgi:hypothetical protein